MKHVQWRPASKGKGSSVHGTNATKKELEEGGFELMCGKFAPDVEDTRGFEVLDDEEHPVTCKACMAALYGEDNVVRQKRVKRPVVEFPCLPEAEMDYVLTCDDNCWILRKNGEAFAYYSSLAWALRKVFELDIANRECETVDELQEFVLECYADIMKLGEQIKKEMTGAREAA